VLNEPGLTSVTLPPVSSLVLSYGHFREYMLRTDPIINDMWLEEASKQTQEALERQEGQGSATATATTAVAAAAAAADDTKVGMTHDTSLDDLQLRLHKIALKKARDRYAREHRQRKEEEAAAST